MGPPVAMIALQTHESGVSRRSGPPRVVWTQGKLGKSPLPLGMQLTWSSGERRDGEEVGPRAGVVIKHKEQGLSASLAAASA